MKSRGMVAKSIGLKVQFADILDWEENNRYSLEWFIASSSSFLVL